MRVTATAENAPATNHTGTTINDHPENSLASVPRNTGSQYNTNATKNATTRAAMYLSGRALILCAGKAMRADRNMTTNAPEPRPNELMRLSTANVQ